MIMAAAKTLASLSPALREKEGTLLPPIGDSRQLGLAVAQAVGKAAIAEGISPLASSRELDQELRDYVWEAVYRPYELVEPC
jgi:malate dehydrogenase (oxaloacetate-decarboxylating)